MQTPSSVFSFYYNLFLLGKVKQLFNNEYIKMVDTFSFIDKQKLRKMLIKHRRQHNFYKKKKSNLKLKLNLLNISNQNFKYISKFNRYKKRLYFLNTSSSLFDSDDKKVSNSKFNNFMRDLI